MGAYIYINDHDRISMRRVTDNAVDEVFQDALKFDPSLMISEHRVVIKMKGLFKTKCEVGMEYTVYHETPAHDGSPYQARMQGSASGKKKVVIAYLHGICNGIIHRNLSCRYSDSTWNGIAEHVSACVNGKMPKEELAKWLKNQFEILQMGNVILK